MLKKTSTLDAIPTLTRHAEGLVSNLDSRFIQQSRVVGLCKWFVLIIVCGVCIGYICQGGGVCGMDLWNVV